MTNPAAYSFRRVTPGDIDLLNTWQRLPHVLEWWGTDDALDAAALADPRVIHWLVTYDGAPFAFIQDYTVHGWEGHHFADLPPGSRGIDQFIGPPDMVGRGHGSAFIRLRMDALFSAGAPVVATDPHPDNARAIAVYEKVGFRTAGPARDTPWGRILPMHAIPD